MASMKAFVEGIVLLGGFLAVAAFCYYAVSKLGDFLDQNQADRDAAYDQWEEQGDLNIAAANPWAMQAGSQVLKDMKREHPNLHCTLSMGEEILSSCIPKQSETKRCGKGRSCFRLSRLSMRTV